MPWRQAQWVQPYCYQWKEAAGTHPRAPYVVLALLALAVAVLIFQFGSGDAAIQVSELGMPILGVCFLTWGMAQDRRLGALQVVQAQTRAAQAAWLRLRCLFALALAFATILLGLILISCCSLILSAPAPPLFSALLAALPGTCALLMVAAVAGLGFRSPWIGFAAAAALWTVDVTLGYSANPLLSLQGLMAITDRLPGAEFWPAGKMAQLAIAAVLWLIVPGRFPGFGQQPTRVSQALGWATAAAGPALYLATGVVMTLSYGWMYRATVPPSTGRWLIQRAHAWGPLDPTPLLGADLQGYLEASRPTVGPPRVPASLAQYQPLRDTGQTVGYVASLNRVEQFEQLLERYPHSIWADCIAWDLARERETFDPPRAVDDYWAVARRFPDSPFTPRALEAALRLDTGKRVLLERGRDGQYGAVFQEGSTGLGPRIAAARLILERYPRSQAALKAAELLAQQFPTLVRSDEMLRADRVAAMHAPPQDRGRWLLQAAQIQAASGEGADAARLAREASSLGAATVPPSQLPGAYSGATVRQQAEMLLRRLETKSP